MIYLIKEINFCQMSRPQASTCKLSLTRASLLNYVSYVLSRFTYLRAFAPYVPSCLVCLRVLRALFLHALITRLAHLICYLRALLTRDIKGNFKAILYMMYISIYIYIYYIYTYTY